MNFSLWIGLCASGISASILVISVLLTLSAADRRANRYLSLVLAVFAVTLAFQLYAQARAGEVLPQLFMLNVAIYLLIGPLLFFYTKALVIRAWRFSVWDIFHFVPFIVGMLFVLTALLQPDEVRQATSAVPLSIRRGQWGLGFRLYLPSALLIGAYAVACLRILRVHRQRVRDEFSSIDHLELSWLRHLSWFMIFISLSIFVPLADNMPRLFWLELSSVALIFYIGHMGLRQPAIFHRQKDHISEPDTSAVANAAVAEPGQPKYRSSGLTEQQADEHWARLEALMASRQPYLNSELTLADLAEQVGLSAAYLSQVINSCANKNFYDYINEKRVDIAKRMLHDQEQRRSVLDIALESGFNSKSTFYTQFKKHCGATPSDYRKRVAQARLLQPLV